MNKAYLMKIQGGVEVDSQGKKAGKGPLIAEEISNTPGTSQDQYLFQPIGVDLYNQCLTGDKAKTLNAIKSDADHVPVVLEHHPNDSRVRIDESGTVQTIDVNGGNPACNQGGVVVVEQMYWDGSQIAGTLTTSNASGAQRMPDKEQFNCVIERVVYPETTGALMASGYNKLGTQEAMNDMFVVCEKTVPKAVSMEVFHCNSAEERTAALKARYYKDPQIIALDRAALNQGKNAKYDFQIDGGGTAQTLIARGPGAVCYRKPVRK